MSLVEARINIGKIIPEPVLKILNELYREGYYAYIIGGAVRDIVQGKSPRDWDIITSAPLDKVVKILEKLGYKKYHIVSPYGSIMLNIDNIHIDISPIRSTYPSSPTGMREETYRQENNIRLEQDIEGRDYTINMLAMSPKGELIDLVNALEDIEKQILRTVRNPEIVLITEPVRILRALRFIAEGYRPTRELEEALRRYGHHMLRLPRGAIRKEIMKTISKKVFSRWLETASRLELLRYLLPNYEPSRKIIKLISIVEEACNDINILTLLILALLIYDYLSQIGNEAKSRLLVEKFISKLRRIFPEELVEEARKIGLALYEASRQESTLRRMGVLTSLVSDEAVRSILQKIVNML